MRVLVESSITKGWPIIRHRCNNSVLWGRLHLSASVDGGSRPVDLLLISSLLWQKPLRSDLGPRTWPRRQHFCFPRCFSILGPKQHSSASWLGCQSCTTSPHPFIPPSAQFHFCRSRLSHSKTNSPCFVTVLQNDFIIVLFICALFRILHLAHWVDFDLQQRCGGL